MNEFELVKEYNEVKDKYDVLMFHDVKKDYYLDLSNKLLIQEAYLDIANKIYTTNVSVFNSILNYLTKLIVLSNKIDPVWYMEFDGRKLFTVKNNQLYRLRQRKPIKLIESLASIKDFKSNNNIQKKILEIINYLNKYSLIYLNNYINSKFYDHTKPHVLFIGTTMELKIGFNYQVLNFNRVNTIQEIFNYYKTWKDPNTKEVVLRAINIIKIDNMLLDELHNKVEEDYKKFEVVNQL